MDAEEAVDRAADFLKKKGGQHVYRLLTVELNSDIWKVKFDTGIVEKETAELDIDDATGRVIKYRKVKDSQS